MARKLSFLLALAVMVAVALLLNLSSAPQIGVAGQAPDQPIDPGTISTNEDVKVDVEVGATHDDGTTGCEELDFSASNAANGTVGAITDRTCNTTDLAADLLAGGFYMPNATEPTGPASSCSDGIDNDSANGIDEADPACLLDIIPVASTVGFPGTGTVQIGSELMTYTGLAAAPCGAPSADVTTPCLTGVDRAELKTTAAAHTAGDSVILRSELSGAFTNTTSAMTAASPAKNENLAVAAFVDAEGFTAPGVLLIDDELIIYQNITAADGTTKACGSGSEPDCERFTDIHRGALGTTAAPHDAGSLVSATLPGDPYPTVLIDIDGPPSPDTIIRVSSLVGLGDNGGIAQIGKEQITFAQTGNTETECGTLPSPPSSPPEGCLTGVVRGAFGTTAVAHDADETIFTIGGNDLDQAVINFTPANNYFNDSVAGSSLVRDPDLDTDTVGDIDETSTILPINTKAGFDVEGGTITIAEGSESETASFATVGNDADDCDPFAPPCLLGLVRGLAGTTAIDPVDKSTTVDQAAASAGFFYTVGKGGLDSTPRQVLISVAPVNDAPVLSGQSVTLAQGIITGGEKPTNPNTNFTITATDVDNTDLVFEVTSIPSAGTLWASEENKNPTGSDPVVTVAVGDEFDVEGSKSTNKHEVVCDPQPPSTDKVANTCTLKFLYAQDSTFDGSDSFTISVTDGKPACSSPPCKDEKGLDTATVTISNSTPTAGPVDKVNVPKNGERTILLTGSDADSGHCELNFIVKTHPEHGNLVLQNNNECRPGDPNTDSATMVYVPDAGYNGPDQFTYQVYDRTGKGAYDAVLGDGHNRTSTEVEINVGGGPEGLIWGDVDCDGDVDAADALKIAIWLAGNPVDQEPGCLEIGTEY